MAAFFVFLDLTADVCKRVKILARQVYGSGACKHLLKPIAQSRNEIFFALDDIDLQATIHFVRFFIEAPVIQSTIQGFKCFSVENATVQDAVLDASNFVVSENYFISKCFFQRTATRYPS